jgi:hypothetical protein
VGVQSSVLPVTLATGVTTRLSSRNGEFGIITEIADFDTFSSAQPTRLKVAGKVKETVTAVSVSLNAQSSASWRSGPIIPVISGHRGF